MQGWFSGGTGISEEQPKAGSPLLAEWNSYGASRDSEEGGTSAFGFNREAAVGSANDTVTGTFNV
ncbi:hypothetical protein SLEP1_g45498 [Rubroshorea leprosula]|uniref:Uncharacterized protein n=1 Tax=Rubroshorea leprosula TaxID=152421 RepID=A0AAV5LJY0_9ROSI|nr:hypothetical protein SLEP1_g45498 [Rubroshorea leprosula]